MKMLWKLTKEASRYKVLYIFAIISTLCLTAVNLAAPKVLSTMTGVVEKGMVEESLKVIIRLTLLLLALYLFRVVFRFLSNYLAHKAAWYLVGDLRSRMYDKLQSLDLGFFHDKQTGDLMSRVVNDTRDFELLYAHMIPEMITNLVTFAGVLIILLVINWRLALITCCPIPLILFSGVIFAKKVRPFFKASQKCMGELNAKLQDNLSGLHEIQSFGQEAVSYTHLDVYKRQAYRWNGIKHMRYGPAGKKRKAGYMRPCSTSARKKRRFRYLWRICMHRYPLPTKKEQN